MSDEMIDTDTTHDAEVAEATADATAVEDGAEALDLGDVDIVAVLAERDEFKDIALRLQADFDNYRKRVSTDVANEVERATGRLAEALLPVLDACEAAVTHGAEGVEPIWSALIGALQREGLVALDLEGKLFDPSVADAVMHEEGDGGEPTVAEVLRTGYEWKGRVLRAAMVKVRG
ncbi:MAG: nucleotide exchange factor GrpE [Ilumatobacteraceae bacterium]